MPLVLVTDTDLGGVDLERAIVEAAGMRLEQAHCRTAQDVIAAAGDARALLVQWAPITAEVFEALPHLQALVRYGTGLDNIDLDAAARAGVAVTGISGYCTDEVADHTLALMLALARGVVEARASIFDGRWKPSGDFEQIIKLRGRTLGVIGYGRIGQAVAARARAFGMNVGAYDPQVLPDVMIGAGTQPLTLEEAFACDVVSLHLPLTPETASFVNRERLALMREGSILVNVSRGGLVDDEALLEALGRSRPMFAGLDVLPVEPPPADHPLLHHPRVLVTPHLGFFSTTSLDELRRKAAQMAVELLTRAPVAAGD